MRKEYSALFGKSVISIEQFNKELLDELFLITDWVAKQNPFILKLMLPDKVLVNLFYEPSTRTSSSFSAAMQRLGGNVISINEVKYSSLSKGETLRDTIRTLELYSDVVVLRHPEVGSAKVASEVARKPIINAGDGIGEHPTQALLDLYTIRKEYGKLNNLRVTFVGDLKHGRTVHSLAKLLSIFNPIEYNYVSPESLEMPLELLGFMDNKGIRQWKHTNLKCALPNTDVLYMTRVQRERFTDPSEYEKVKGSYDLSLKDLNNARDKMIIMHPLPRVGEIAEDVDADPRAVYFRQMEYGMQVRMALLLMVLHKYNLKWKILYNNPF